MSTTAGRAELHTFILIKNLHRLVRATKDGVAASGEVGALVYFEAHNCKLH